MTSSGGVRCAGQCVDPEAESATSCGGAVGTDLDVNGPQPPAAGQYGGRHTPRQPVASTTQSFIHGCSRAIVGPQRPGHRPGTHIAPGACARRAVVAGARSRPPATRAVSPALTVPRRPRRRVARAGSRGPAGSSPVMSRPSSGRRSADSRSSGLETVLDGSPATDRTTGLSTLGSGSSPRRSISGSRGRTRARASRSSSGRTATVRVRRRRRGEPNSRPASAGRRARSPASSWGCRDGRCAPVSEPASAVAGPMSAGVRGRGPAGPGRER